MPNTLTMRRLRNGFTATAFEGTYNALLLGNKEALNESKLKHLLKIAIVLLNIGDKNLKILGYRIILCYSNLYNDYQPLYDAAINLGYIPISSFIEEKHFNGNNKTDSFFGSFQDAYQHNYFLDGIFMSKGQKELIDFSKNNHNSYAIIAPTSYGKSEIIISKVAENLGKKLVVIVPSKALLAQTKKRLLDKLSGQLQRIITHPDMYKETDNAFVAVLTQERLLRLLQKEKGLIIDLVLIDEAHNLLSENERSILLSQVLLIIKNRNEESIFNYYTPFLTDAKNLRLPYKKFNIDSIRTNESLKVEKFFTIDFTMDGKQYLYDQFTNNFILKSETIWRNEKDFILNNSSNKNIIYLNRPRDIERFSIRLINPNNQINDELLNELKASISEYVHPEYNLLKCINKGIVYHHGGMPEIIRLYVEDIFSSNDLINYIITSSTLLEGVNIPAEKIFLLTTKIGRRNFSKSQFKNLIGRVCRFSEVFNRQKGSLTLLEPEIHILKGDYEWNNANQKNFLRKTAKVDIQIADSVDNVMLVEDVSNLNEEEKKKLDTAIEYLENIEPNTIETEGINYASTEIAKSCYNNNITAFDIKSNEAALNTNLDYLNEYLDNEISDVTELVNAIHTLFISNIHITEENFKRFEHEATRNFYAMLLNWRTTGSSYKQMISKFTKYWESLDNPVIFVGSRWGEITFGEDNVKELYIDLSDKSESQKINLAILRIKEEQDFVDNNIMKYVETLNDLELLNQTFYDRIKYGSSDPFVICLLKNGFSMELAKCLSSADYKDFIYTDFRNDTVLINQNIIRIMTEKEENRILIFEVKYHIN